MLGPEGVRLLRYFGHAFLRKALSMKTLILKKKNKQPNKTVFYSNLISVGRVSIKSIMKQPILGGIFGVLSFRRSHGH